MCIDLLVINNTWTMHFFLLKEATNPVLYNEETRVSTSSEVVGVNNVSFKRRIFFVNLKIHIRH